MTIWTLIQRAQRGITRLIKRVRNYLFFRGLGHGVTAAWEKSGRTL
jgi:hypothetical protein